MKKIWMVFSLLAAASVVSGCMREAGKTETGPGKEEEKQLKPVTIKVMQYGVYFTEDMFKKLIYEPVTKKYPHITPELINAKADMDTVIATGETFDLWASWSGKLPGYKPLGIFEDITPLAKRYQFDLSRFDQGALNPIRGVSDKGELIALPFMGEINALYYNKDLFDKFGVPYPKDGMTWEDAIDLARALTREENGVKYSGLDEQNLLRLLFPLSLNYVDGRTNKVLEPFDLYKKAFETGKAIHSITGNESGNGPNRFYKDKTLAMIAANNLLTTLISVQDMNWDVAQFPSYRDKPNVYGMSPSAVLIPNKSSKHQEEIMRIMEVLFSDEVQTVQVSQFSQVSLIDDPKFGRLFGSGVPQLKTKNLAGIFKSKPASGTPYSFYYNESSKIAGTKYNEYVKGVKDVNTALKEAKEEIEKKMNEDKQ